MDTLDAILLWLHGHPGIERAAISYAVWFLLASGIINGLRTAWPVTADRPRNVRFLLGFMDLTVLNVWFVLRRYVPGVQGPAQDDGATKP